jgi:cardiolipin synthase
MEGWTHTELFHSGDAYYTSLLSRIRRARKSITLETYIFAVDRLTQILLEELGQARQRGCQVQLLIDGFGSYYWLPDLEKICREKDLEWRVYHPLPRGFSWFRRYLLLNLFSLKAWRLFKNLNKRNHRKITIIDETTAYLGSLNFTQFHSENIMGRQAWRDTGVCVEGPPVTMLVAAFARSWRRARKRTLSRAWFRYRRDRGYDPRHSLVRLNSTPRMRYRVYRDLIRRIREARSHIYVTTAYFLPKRSLLRALKNAAARGVHVELIVPGITDVPLVRWAAFSIARTLLKSHIFIYEYQNRVLHAKYMIIDDYCSVGSLNLNHRSLLHDLEVEVVLTAPADRENMLRQWEIDKAHSKSLTEQSLRNTSFWRHWLSRIAFKLRYLL